MRSLVHRHVTLRQRSQRIQRLRQRRPQPSLGMQNARPEAVEREEPRIEDEDGREAPGTERGR